MNSENLKNNLNSERESLSADERKVCDLMGKLDRVDCPKNFDFRLKARIASADKKAFQPSVWQTLRYILPVAACGLIVAFVMVQTGMFSTVNQTGNQIAISPNPNIQPFDGQQNSGQIFTVTNSTSPVIASAANRNASPNAPQSIDVALTNSSKNRTALPKRSRDDEPTMSRDFGVKQNRKTLYPNGINPEKIKPVIIENSNDKPILTNGVLDMLGISTDAVSGKLRVKNVRENSIADKSGIKAGDVIESLDDTKITQGETTLRSRDVKKITVSRDGKIIGIRPKMN